MELEVEDQKDHEQGERQDDREGLLGADLVLVASGKREAHSRRDLELAGRDLAFEEGLGLLDDVDLGRIGRLVEHDVANEEGVLALDDLRARRVADLGELLERDLLAGRRRDQNATEGVDAVDWERLRGPVSAELGGSWRDYAEAIAGRSREAFGRGLNPSSVAQLFSSIFTPIEKGSTVYSIVGRLIDRATGGAVAGVTMVATAGGARERDMRLCLQVRVHTWSAVYDSSSGGRLLRRLIRRHTTASTAASETASVWRRAGRATETTSVVASI